MITQLNSFLSRSAFCLGSLLFAQGAFAASLAWDPSHNPGGTVSVPTGSGGTGSWTNGSGADWSTSATDITWNNTNGDSAIFGGTGATVTLGSDITTAGITINSTSYTLAKDTGNAFTLTVNGTITNNQTATITAKLAGTSGLTKAGSGTLVLNAANSYTGATTIQSGTLQARATGALTTGTTVTIGNGSSNATLDVRASQTIAGIGNSGSGTATINQSQTTGTTTLTINPSGAGLAAADSTFAGTIKDGDATHLLAITKAGSNTLTLTGTNSYSGATTISGGTLKLGSSLTGSTTVIVSGGTLSGNDTTGNIDLGTGAVSMSSGAISAGGSAVGSFTLAAGQTFTTTGGTLNFDIGASFDQIIGSGSFSLTNTTLALDGLTSVAGSYQLFSGFNGSNSISGLTITGLAQGLSGSLDTNGLLTVSGSAVPEPSAYATLAAAAALGFVALRRKNRR
jgi:autotransporter-associated beta strand protein